MPKGRRGYYKQPDSIWREPWPIEDKGTLANLQAYLNERWARDGIPDSEAGRAVISIQNLQAITGTRTGEAAWRRIQSATSHVCCSAAASLLQQTRSGASSVLQVSIDWPKYAEYQHNFGEFARESRAKEGLRITRPASSSSDQKTDPQKFPPTPRAKREPKAVPPEALQFTADFVDGLVATNEGFQGPTPSGLAGWHKAARLLLQERPLPEAQDLARWLFEDDGPDASFWRPNVMSLPKFRERYDRLQAVKRRPAHVNGAKVGPLTSAIRAVQRQIDEQYGPRSSR